MTTNKFESFEDEVKRIVHERLEYSFTDGAKIKAGLHQMFVAIDEGKLEEARSVMKCLQAVIGDDPELLKAKVLLKRKELEPTIEIELEHCGDDNDVSEQIVALHEVAKDQTVEEEWLLVQYLRFKTGVTFDGCYDIVRALKDVFEEKGDDDDEEYDEEDDE